MSDLYRSKPVVVAARQWDGTIENANELIAWLDLDTVRGIGYDAGRVTYVGDVPILIYRSAMGFLRIFATDWVVRGLTRAYRVMTNQEFHMVYDPIAGMTDDADDTDGAKTGSRVLPAPQTDDPTPDGSADPDSDFVPANRHVWPPSTIETK